MRLFSIGFGNWNMIISISRIDCVVPESITELSSPKPSGPPRKRRTASTTISQDLPELGW